MNATNIAAVASHKEHIVCPTCEAKQTSTVDHTVPFWSYVHECTACKYIITESEWEQDETPRCEKCASENLRHTPGATGWSNIHGEQDAPGWYECFDCGHQFEE